MTLVTIYESFIRPCLDYADSYLANPVMQLFLIELNQLNTVLL